MHLNEGSFRQKGNSYHISRLWGWKSESKGQREWPSFHPFSPLRRWKGVTKKINITYSVFTLTHTHEFRRQIDFRPAPRLFSLILSWRFPFLLTSSHTKKTWMRVFFIKVTQWPLRYQIPAGSYSAESRSRPVSTLTQLMNLNSHENNKKSRLNWWSMRPSLYFKWGKPK